MGGSEEGVGGGGSGGVEEWGVGGGGKWVGEKEGVEEWVGEVWVGKGKSRERERKGQEG